MSSSDLAWHQQQMAIFWIVVVLAVAVVVTVLRRDRRDSGASQESPEQALKRRYANGEIDEKTYEHMLDELRK